MIYLCSRKLKTIWTSDHKANNIELDVCSCVHLKCLGFTTSTHALWCRRSVYYNCSDLPLHHVWSFGQGVTACPPRTRCDTINIVCLDLHNWRYFFYISLVTKCEQTPRKIKTPFACILYIYIHVFEFFSENPVLTQGMEMFMFLQSYGLQSKLHLTKKQCFMMVHIFKKN